MNFRIILIIFISLVYITNTYAKNERIIIASTTSTHDTGLMKYLNNKFYEKFNITVNVLSLGTGQAIEIAKNGDADILLVHDTNSENKFVKEGFGIKRYQLMYNDYILVGPNYNQDKCESIENSLIQIKENKYIFISRGDESGTHKKEKLIWKVNKLNHESFGKWYKEIGQGMGATLMMANNLFGYTLSDRSTWISFKEKNNLKIICQNDPILKNQYGIIAVNPKINNQINYKGAKKYINWIISDEGKNLINNFKINGEQLFFFNNH